MGLILVTAPAREPLDITAAKAHLRVETMDDDALIESLITTARQYAEAVTARAILTQTWDYSIQDWPAGNAIRLPFGNLQSVTSVTWKDSDGAATTLTENTDYVVELNGEDYGRIVLPYAGIWPSGVLYPSNPITVRFICGWESSTKVPYYIIQAIKLLCGKLYETRGEDTLGQTVHQDPTADRLLFRARLWGEFS